MQIVIEVGKNEIDQPLFVGFLAASPDAPDGLERVELEPGDGNGRSGRLVCSFTQAVTDNQLGELLRVLGGSAKGDDAMRVIEPQQFAGRESMPNEAPGARRWPCPRCAATVIEGKNAEPGFNGGLCKQCAAVDRKLASGQVMGQAPRAAAAAPPPVQVPANLRRPATEQAGAEQLPEGVRHNPAFVDQRATALPIVANLTELQRLRPAAPVIVFVADRQVLGYWTGAGWRICEGIYPPIL